ncbi:hypothetical protein [Paenibacillus hexagrammi]|uniref:Uncharacterized protein n=1 Tax=Paenibacillus hexagrammi TaxID=2908839 RepID=A0ABY3SEU4_9BACL|nr:hypothetical protein [Paenibacillus sp. YPD9-1]UJF32509.1 hypothetical protein L0M14_22975 [Paenibacillus sp. YPD9-1]
MRRNILLSFAAHVLALIVTLIVFAMGSHAVFLGLAIVAALLTYAACGYACLRPLNNAITSLLSVSFVSLIGLMIGLYGLIFPSPMGFNWMIFLGYHLYVFGLFQALQFDPGPPYTIWFFITPSLFLWLGLQLRLRRKGRSN